MLDYAQLKKEISTCRVLCVGDVILDRYIIGQAERLSPEAPVPVLLASEEKLKVGGAANVVDNLASLGVACTLVGALGDDKAGRALSGLLTNKCELNLAILPEASTTEKIRIMAGDKHLMRVDREHPLVLSKAQWSAILEQKILPALAACDVVVLSDYGKGFLTPALTQAIIQEAQKRAVPIAVDPKGADYGLYKGATLITPNKKELSLATGGQSTETLDACVLAAQSLGGAVGAAGILVTRGAQGMVYVTPKGTKLSLPARAREVYDVSGAGDTVIALMAVGLGLNWEISKSMELATLCAGIVVGKVGTNVVTQDDLAKALNSSKGASGLKVLSVEKAAAQVRAWQAAGHKVGFTNGCFDLLHLGHLSSLDFAANQCDKLVVGVNSDASVGRLKGPGRPVQDEHTRAHVLAALGLVDGVILFDEDTPLSVITSLLPDVLIKGADYVGKEVAGAEVVEKNGGRVVFAPLIAGHSTSQTIEKLTPVQQRA